MGHKRVAVCFHRKQDTDGPWPTTVWLTIFHSTEVCKRWTFIGSALCTLILVISQASDMRTVPSRECWAAAARAAPGQPRDYAGKRPTPHIPSRVTAGSAPLRLLLMVGMGRARLQLPSPSLGFRVAGRAVRAATFCRCICNF